MRIKDLKKEIKANIPDLSDKISAMTDWQSIALNSAETNKKINQAAKKPIKKSWSFAFAAIAAVLVMAIVLPVTLNNKTAPVVAKADYEVVIEVKPSTNSTINTFTASYASAADAYPAMKFTVNGNNDKVITHYGLNEDGVDFLFGDKYSEQTIDAATKTVCDKLKNYNIVNGTKILRVTAYSSDSKTHKVLENKRSHIASKIQNLLSGDIGSVTYIDDDLIDEIEDTFNGDEFKNQIKELIKTLKGKLKPLIEQKIADIENLIALFKEKYDDDERVSLDMATMFKVVEFSRKYDYELEFDLVKTKGKYINEFIEDLTDLKEELAECLEEIDEDSDDDYGEILADLIEMAKESIFNN